MLTLWNGPGVPPMNVVSTDVFVPQVVDVVLQDPPQLVTRVPLDAHCHAANLYTGGTDVVWWAVDTDPGPLNQPSSGPLVPETDYRPGHPLTPGMWQQAVLPLDSLPHMLHLVSAAPFVRVYVVMLMEGGDL